MRIYNLKSWGPLGLASASSGRLCYATFYEGSKLLEALDVKDYPEVLIQGPIDISVSHKSALSEAR